ncbi:MULTISPECIES: CarD family transcriptional regulator [Leucobacter]|uniref:CarD family transcriptional regulator n=1 Tax=Leucobacter TaxID=55968 RepID=UPI0006A7E08C|nr:MULTISPECIES: CarD family transcriptional regulator [Leucobacter]
MQQSHVVGHTLVYPHHGAVTITAIEVKKIGGVERTWLTLQPLLNELSIQIPADQLNEIGVRELIDSDGIAELIDILQEEFIEEPGNWSRRFKANGEKLASGSVHRVGEVVRDLWRRSQGAKLSTGEKAMYQRASGILVTEFALARGIAEADAHEEVEKILAGEKIAV